MTSKANHRQITLSSLIAPGWAAVKFNYRPFLLLQGIAIALVIGYYHIASLHNWAERLSTFKQSYGLLGSAISAAFAGALLPEIARLIMLGDLRFDRQRLNNITFAFCIFALNGIIVDLQYRLIALWVGNDTHFLTAFKKMLVDQFITTPTFGTPYWVVGFAIRKNRYRVMDTLRQLSGRWYLLNVGPLLLPGWVFWIPMTLAIFSLPLPLQFVLFLFAAAGWSLIIVFVTGATTAPEPIALESTTAPVIH